MPAAKGKTPKRIVVACDGTWVNSDNGFVRESWLPWKTGGRLANASNVTRICRALLPRSKEGVSQVVYYQGGLGSANSFWSYLLGGYLGDGISENIREAYAFICTNYEEGDEIFLIGFSRGAFTARSIGGLISSIGLLTKKGQGAFYPIFQDWEHQADKAWVPKYGSATWPVQGRPSFRDQYGQYMKKLVAEGLTRPDVPIKAIAVWDTVGTLGVPDMKLFGFSIYSAERREYSFINTEVANNVENAYQALAIDEKREPFGPTVWESPKEGSGAILKELKQCWFPGVHTSVGGGHQDTSIADVTLAWMMTQLSPHLAFSPSYVSAQRAQNEAFYQYKQVPVRPYGMGLIIASDVGLATTITGRKIRTPGSYHAMNPVNGKPLPRMLTNTCEFMHPSIRYRLNQKGPGLAKSEDDIKTGGYGVYNPAVMVPKDSWTWCPPGQPWPREELGFDQEAVQWDSWGKWIYQRKDGGWTYLVEDKIENDTVQMELLKGWGELVAKDVLKP